MSAHDLDDKCFECCYKKANEHWLDVITAAFGFLQYGNIVGAIIVLRDNIGSIKKEVH